MIYSISPEPLEVIEPIQPPSRPRTELPTWGWLGPAAMVSLALHFFALLLSSIVTVVEAEPDPPGLDTRVVVSNEEPKRFVYLVPETALEELLRSIGYNKPVHGGLIVRGVMIHSRIGSGDENGIMPEPTVSEELLRSIRYYKPARALVIRGGGGIRARIGSADDNGGAGSTIEIEGKLVDE